jgi:hypothetical protein
MSGSPVDQNNLIRNSEKNCPKEQQRFHYTIHKFKQLARSIALFLLHPIIRIKEPSLNYKYNIQNSSVLVFIMYQSIAKCQW